MRSPRVLVLLDERDPYPAIQRHLIWRMVRLWQRWDLDIRIARGPRDPAAAAAADLVFPHVNLSVTPPEYRAFLDRRSNVVNAGVYDISKRVVSSNLVSANDGYEGPVVVKTDLNYGGIPERAHQRRGRGRRLLRALGRRVPWRRPSRKASLVRARFLEVEDYRIFDAKRDVPPGVFENPALVVERFLPERRGKLYYCRHYVFLGDREIHFRLVSRSPIVKGRNVLLEEEIPPDPRIIALRHELGFDYGKLDYVVPDGDVVLLDANRTPGLPPDEATARGKAAQVAPGIHAFLRGRAAARRIS